jgi:FkbM family methyltransferase
VLATIKRILKMVPPVRLVHARLRSWSDEREGKRLFDNPDVYIRALNRKSEGRVVLRTHDGLNLTIRQNVWDARIVREIFFDRPYVRRFTPPPGSTIVDIGGYIGDFSLYAAKYLRAGRVIVYEPTVENFAILKQNIANNGYEDRIVAVHKAVGGSNKVLLNVQIQEGEEVHASAYWYQGAEQRAISSVTLSELFDEHRLDSIDLLKIDCEGGEYDILAAVPDQLFERIRALVVEYHRIDGFEPQLDRMLSRLTALGYRLWKDGSIVSACRA